MATPGRSRSETCALDLIGATYVRDVEPGEVLIIGPHGPRSIKPFPPSPLSHCIFEHVYFARPDSEVFGQSVNEVRTNLGRALARETGIDADVVVPIPDSGVCAAIGYSEESNIPLRFGLIRNHYVGRTFIEPAQSIRHFGVKVKLNPVKSILVGKRVILIDDSIVRGTTSRKIVKMVRAAGASEVHLRISCPPTISPCFYGVDTPRRQELIAATHTLDEICKYVGADSLGYLSLDGLMSSVNGHETSYCTSCYTGHYPVAFPRDQNAYLQLSLKIRRQARAASRRRGRNGRLCCSRSSSYSLFVISSRLAQERGPTTISPAELRQAIDHLERPRLQDAHDFRADRSPLTSGAGGSSASPGHRRTQRWVCPLPRAHPAHRLQRSTNRRHDEGSAGVAQRSPSRSRLPYFELHPRSRH